MWKRIKGQNKTEGNYLYGIFNYLQQRNLILTNTAADPLISELAFSVTTEAVD